MPGFPSPFGGEKDDDGLSTDSGEFTPEYSPEPDRFLEGHRLLTGDEHVSFHQISETMFEERGVYDMTFGYNLTQLNQVTRHPNAGVLPTERHAHEGFVPREERSERSPRVRPRLGPCRGHALSKRDHQRNARRDGAKISGIRTRQYYEHGWCAERIDGRDDELARVR